MNKLKFLYSSLYLYRKKIFKIFFFEIYYLIKYFKSGNFFKPPDIYPCPYYFIHKISQFVNKKKIGSIIDLGCGSGRITNFLNDTTKAKIYGYEIDNESYQIAKEYTVSDATATLVYAVDDPKCETLSENDCGNTDEFWCEWNSTAQECFTQIKQTNITNCLLVSRIIETTAIGSDGSFQLKSDTYLILYVIK